MPVRGPHVARGCKRAVGKRGGMRIAGNEQRIAEDAGPALEQFHDQGAIVALDCRHERVTLGCRIDRLDVGELPVLACMELPP